MFAYCRNTPVSRIDVSGTYDQEIADGEFDHPCDDIEGPQNTGSGVKTQKSIASYSSTGNHSSVMQESQKAAKEAQNKGAGSYRIMFESGYEYDGKGSLKRAKVSAGDKCKPNEMNNFQGDSVRSIEWYRASSDRQAFIDEYGLQLNHYNEYEWEKTYNKIWSPGRGYLNAK